MDPQQPACTQLAALAAVARKRIVSGQMLNRSQDDTRPGGGGVVNNDG
jgi:hypothetical protein